MIHENMTQFPSRFVSYPTNRLIAHFASREQVKGLLPFLENKGIDLGSIYILDGQEGIDALDPSGEAHGVMAKISRTIHQGGSSTEREKIEGLVKHLSKGGIAVAVYAKKKALRDSLIELYRTHEGTEITYAATFYIEDFKAQKSSSKKWVSQMNNSKNKSEVAVKQAIDELIQTATNYDVDVLERIYHDKLQVVMVDTDDNVNTADKAAFKSLFQTKKDAGDPPMNTWAHYHRIDVDGDKAHVLLSRKNDLSGTNMILILSIDLVHEDDRWQVLREVIFLRPEDT